MLTKEEVIQDMEQRLEAYMDEANELMSRFRTKGLTMAEFNHMEATFLLISGLDKALEKQRIHH